MAKITAFQSFDMSAFDVTAVDAATVVGETATRVVLVNGTTRYVYVGTGLTLDGSDNPTAGTVTDFLIVDASGTPANVFAIRELSIDYVDIDALVQAGDTDAFFATLLDGNDKLTGSGGNDVLSGYDGMDRFLLAAGGDDTANGGNDDDVFAFGDTFDGSDSVDGGGGNDAVNLVGSTIAIFGANTITNVERINLAFGGDYELYLDNGNVGAGNTLTIDGHGLGVDDYLQLDASAVSDGAIVAIGGDGLDYFKAGSAQVTFLGGQQDDLFEMGANLSSDDVIDGGFDSGYPFGDEVVLDGDYSTGFTFGATTMTNVEVLTLETGFSYTLVTNDATVAAGATLVIDAILDSGEVLNFDGSAETNGFFEIIGGFGDDYIIGGKRGDFIDGESGNNTIFGGGGADILLGCDNQDTLNGGSGDDQLIGDLSADTMNGGGGYDAFFYSFAVESTSLDFDTIIGFDAEEDYFAPSYLVTTVDAAVTTGSLSYPTFNADLAAAIGATELGTGPLPGEEHAVLFTPDGGDFAGELFVIINTNGVAGYQASQDLVIHLEGAKHMDLFSEFNFF